MSVTITYSCSGCDAEASVMAPIESVDLGRGYWRNTEPRIMALAPDGWVAYDPYTFVCYCPACWAQIVSDDPCDRESWTLS